MKVLVYPHDMNMGGSQTNAIELAAAVSQLGHECVVFGRPGTLCARVEELGLEFIESPDPGRRPSARIAKALRDIIRERGIDVVHGYEWPPGLEACMAAEGLPEVAAVCTVMSMAVAPFLPRWLPLVVGTQQISAREQSSGRVNVTLIEPPVDLEHNGHRDPAAEDRFRQDLGLDDRPLVVCVSRLVPELKSEGLMTAIEVAATLGDRAPFLLAIVGEGRARPALEQAAARANERIGRRTVALTGELLDPRPAYGAADIVLGMGGSALRSLAFGKPLVVQGEGGYFRTLTPQSVEEFRWQGWYGVGDGTTPGATRLEAELEPLVLDHDLRRRLGHFSSQVVQDFSLDRAARRQVTVYRDACAAREEQKRRPLEAARSVFLLGAYHVGQRLDRWQGLHRADDFNVEPVAARPPATTGPATAGAAGDGPILYFPGVGWGTTAGTDRHLATALAKQCPVIWVDTPHSILRRRDRVVPAVSHPQSDVVRLRAPTLVGVQRPFLRELANRRRARVARRYLAEQGLRPRAVIVSTTAPMLGLLGDTPGVRVYYATDDFVEASRLWGVSKKYLNSAREKNLRAADLVLAVTPELVRHLQRSPEPPLWLPNGADVDRLTDLDHVEPAEVPLRQPIVGVVGQFNARTDLEVLEAVRRTGNNLLLVGPRWFASADDDVAFARLVSRPGVHWVDEVPRDQLPPYLRALRVGLTPYADSMFNRRSYPLKTLEYLAAGVPVVSTDSASLCGLDPRYVNAARTTAEFCKRLDEVVGAGLEPGEIRRSVESADWNARAAQLLAWLHQEDVS